MEKLIIEINVGHLSFDDLAIAVLDAASTVLKVGKDGLREKQVPVRRAGAYVGFIQIKEG